MNTAQIEYDPKLIEYKQLLSVFWSSHDSTQDFGQGPDVGNQYRWFMKSLSDILFITSYQLFAYKPKHATPAGQ